MKKLILYVALLLTGSLQAINNVNHSQPSPKKPSLSTRAGDCVQGVSKINLDVNNVRAMLLNSGDMWWDRDRAKYGVPKLPLEQLQAGVRQVAPIFAGAIWVSGKNQGNLLMAAIRFSSEGKQFWPGPIVVDGGGNAADPNAKQCNKFDRFWKVNRQDIENAVNGVSISDAIRFWPGKGNLELTSAAGGFTTEELDMNLAPFYDKPDPITGISDGIYNPNDGDYPTIKYTTDRTKAAYADEMIFWVINDAGNAHIVPDAAQVGVQMNCLAFAYQTSDELNNMTFYTYEITKKSPGDLEETYMSQFVDCDLGNYNDDYVGCDTVRNMGFCYNADADDETVTGAEGYGKRPPILAVDFFEGPAKLSSFVYFENAQGTPISDPSTDVEHRNNQEGKTRGGQAFTLGGTCTGGTVPTKFCFPGNPNISSEWSMCSAALNNRDRRFVQNSGPFTLISGAPQTISVGVIFVQPPQNSQQGCKVDFGKYLYKADEKAQRLFDFGFKNERGPDAPELKIFEASNKVYITLENPISSNNYGERYNKRDLDVPSFPKTPGRVNDTMFKFEGYLIYQVKKSTISSFDELQDPENAALIKFMDLRNRVTYPKVYTGTVATGFNPIDSLPFNNSGIDKQFEVTEDKFEQSGQKFLINNKTYYFVAVAVAFNNYYDTLTKERQTKQYKVSSNIEVYSAVPHDASFYGVNTKAKMGQYLDVTREKGVGHGSYFLDILQSDEDDIVQNNSKDIITYIGGKAPINVLVNDPYKLQKANYTLRIKDTSMTQSNDFFRKDSSYWTLDITNRSGRADTTIASEDNIDRGTEQSIYTSINDKLEALGISIAPSFADSTGIMNRFLTMTNNTSVSKHAKYDVVGGEIVYSDEKKKWVTLLKNASGDYTNWIKGGDKYDSLNQKTTSMYNNVNNRRVWTDSANNYTNIIEGRIAPYCLADNKNTRDNTNNDANYASNGPGFKWRNLSTALATVRIEGEGPENNLDSLFSVNIVITPTETKWSECLVLEVGEEQLYNDGNARKGQIRKAVSPLVGAPTDTGRSIFPGYAINVETGVRVNIYFGENSSKHGENAANMIWDPGTIVKTKLGSPIMAGGHYIYVTNTPYDGGKSDADILLANFNKLQTNGQLDTNVRRFYRSLIWTCIPVADTGYSLVDYTNNKYTIPNEVKIKVRVQKPYMHYLDGGAGGESVYTFGVPDSLLPISNVTTLLDSSFNNMRIVPNPYNAYSIYEQSSAQNIVKFIGVPKNSTISIFTTDGILVRKIKLGNQSDDNYLAANISNGQVNYDDAYSWDMRTTSGLLVASGIYYIHVVSPGRGEKVMKLFATMRTPDVSNF